MLPRPLAITARYESSYMLKSTQGPAQDFILGISALYVKGQEGVWEAHNPGMQMAFL